MDLGLHLSTPEQEAAECYVRLRGSRQASDLGYLCQALAAHVLLRLGFGIRQICTTGHPDIVACRGESEFRFEIEAQVGRPRLRQLTTQDFSGLISARSVGYFGLLEPGTPPKWTLVDVTRLARRSGPIPQSVLHSLRDKHQSDSWTNEMTGLLAGSCRLLEVVSYEELRRQALHGMGL